MRRRRNSATNAALRARLLVGNLEFWANAVLKLCSVEGSEASGHTPVLVDRWTRRRCRSSWAYAVFMDWWRSRTSVYCDGILTMSALVPPGHTPFSWTGGLDAGAVPSLGIRRFHGLVA